MKVYIQANKQGQIDNDNNVSAWMGFREMGFEVVPFSTPKELSSSRPCDVVVGYVGTVKQRLYELGFSIEEVNYPDELKQYLGRKVWTSRIDTINSNPDLWPVFVKPFDNKVFTGVAVHSPKDLIGCGGAGDNAEVFCSDVVNFKAEWRCFVRYGEIVDVRPYKGDWHEHFDPKVFEDAVNAYTTAPAGYAIDFGLTDDGRLLLIEVNDGYALGSYGLLYYDYAKLLSARWAELTHTTDECDF